MATYTPNYGLHQWESSDDFLRTDFNTDLSKIDTALGALQSETAEKIGIVLGSYRGDYTENRFISLGFTPVAVILEQDDGSRDGYGHGGLAFAGHPSCTTGIVITEGGFTVTYSDDAYTNNQSSSFYYMAFR